MILIAIAAELAEYILVAREQGRPATVYLDPDRRVAIMASGQTSQHYRRNGRWYIDREPWPTVTEAQRLVTETEAPANSQAAWGTPVT